MMMPPRATADGLSHAKGLNEWDSLAKMVKKLIETRPSTVDTSPFLVCGSAVLRCSMASASRRTHGQIP
jgi:hypothetical protein